MSNIDILENKISAFKQKLLFNILLKGSLFFLIVTLSVFIFLNYLEYFLYLNSTTKTIFIFSFFSLFIFLLIKNVIIPSKEYIDYEKSLTTENAAKIIGRYFPEINDKLLNTIQLKSFDNQTLAMVSASQKAEFFTKYSFDNAIEKDENRQLYKWVFLPFILLIFTLLYNSNIVFEGSQRLLDFNKTYQPPSPFEISISTSDLKAFKNEDFTFSFDVLSGFSVENVYINYNGVKKKANLKNDNHYEYTFSNIQNDMDFDIEISGYKSNTYKVSLINRPSLTNAKIEIMYPRYLNKKNETFNSLTNLTLPEGSKVDFNFNTSYSSKQSIRLNDSSVIIDDNYNLIASQNLKYELVLENDFSKNKEKYEYFINVIKDEYPTLEVNSREDTALYNYILIDGQITDDYGFSKLTLNYKLNGSKNHRVNIPINKTQPSQTFVYNWLIDSLKLSSKDKLEYYIEVWDNDGVNGSKKTISAKRSLNIPDLNKVNEKLKKESENIENQLDKTLEKLKEERENNEDLNENIKQKKKLDWNDKKNIQQNIEKQNELRKELEKLNEQFKTLNQKQEKLSKQSESIKEKSKQLEKLMNEVLDEETKKLYEELQKLLNEQKPNDEKIKKVLDELNKKDENLEKELERALDLMKQLKLQLETEKLANKLEELSKKQEELSEKTKDKVADNEELKKEQEKIKEEFEKAKKDIKDLDKLNEELNKEEDKFDQNTVEQQKSAEEEMQKSSDQLTKNQNKKASQSQKKAASQMKKMSEKLNEMAMSGEMEQQEEDLQTIRQILENLVTLSFDQEQLMDKFKTIKKVNPQFVEHSSAQIKIKDDSQIIEDSLLALASRNFQIESFVTDELFEMNDKIDKSLEAIRDRKVNKTTVNQHLAMTSMNNLALLLSDVQKQMQQQMANQMEGNQTCNKPKNKPGGKKLSMLQKQLGEKISELKKSGKQGKELSEELAKLAAEQEAIREALKEQEKEGGTQPGGNKPLENLMEENEKDLVNKRLLNLSQQRQEEILSRLLESEKAMRERDLDEKREAEKAKNLARKNPPALEEYLKQKEKEIELLKTVSPNYSPYYKREIKEYFENETF